MSAQPIRNLRWWIGGMLFLSTIINYLDRQTLSLLAPFLKVEYHWTNTDYANILVGFRLGYSLGQTILGRMIDRIGTRRGLSITVVLYSLVASAPSLARESGNGPMGGGRTGGSRSVSQTAGGRSPLLFSWGVLRAGAPSPFFLCGDFSSVGVGVFVLKSGVCGVFCA